MKGITVHEALLASAILLLSAFVPAAWAGAGFSLGGTEGKNGQCPQCHFDKARVGKSYIDPARYNETTHARIGCPSCHDSVTGTSHALGGSSAKSSCRDCHADILAEYGAGAHATKASCTGCHDPHKVKSPQEISGQEVNRMCASCHDHYRMMTLHSDWLPQADLHLDMLPCVTCHTGSQNYVINLYIVRNKGLKAGKPQVASFDELRKLSGGSEIVSLVDTNGDGYISLAELRMFNRNGHSDDLRLKGMMTPERVTHTYQILENRRDCSFCHAKGAGAMQTSWLEVPTKSGNFTRVAVEKGAVMDALYATPDFYMTGATRNGNLNIVGAVIIAGGLVMPVGHGFIRFLTRKNREKGERS